MKTAVVRRLEIIAALLPAVFVIRTADATALLVYNNNDSGAGSLRQAILDNQSLGGGNTIIFSNIVTGTITLSGGELLISESVTILGPGANVLSVNGNAASRVFYITNGATAVIAGLTIANGSASGLGVAAAGGGIFNDHSTLTVSNCTISGNTAGTLAGGIYNDGRTSSNATLTVSGTTFSGNTCFSGGGGIFNDGAFGGNAFLIVSDCTLSGNSANLTFGGAGAIHNYGVSSGGFAVLTVTASTFSGNSSGAGGIVNDGSSSGLAELYINDTILKAGASGSNIFNNSGYVISSGYNLCDDDGGGTLTNAYDRIDTDPMIGPLQDNGGPTPTIMPLAGSPAIDQGKNFSGLATDQRGRCRTYDDPSILNVIGGDATDIGAVEINPAHSSVVNTTNDNGVSLRWCVCDTQPGDVVTFAPTVTNTITLTGGDLFVRKDATITGPGAKVLSVNGNRRGRVFHLVPGTTVNISGLTITNGFATNSYPDGGGGILNDHATLTLNACVIADNSNGGAGNGIGGGICSDGSILGSATLTMNSCTLSSNTGVGIFNYGEDNATNGAMLTMSNCTLSGNSSGSYGGIWNAGSLGHATLTVISCTLSGNSATTNIIAYVGGIYNDGNSSGNAKLTIGDTILKAGALGSNLVNNSGTVTSLGYNISSDSAGGLLNATADQINTDPMLGALADNGGPTPTVALQPGSPAIDKGKSFGLLTDQRGAPRIFDFLSIPNAAGGDGSDIGAFERGGNPTLNIQQAGGSVVLSWPWYYGDFSLQSSTNIALSNSWVLAAGLPAVIGNQYQQINGRISGDLFFRLREN